MGALCLIAFVHRPGGVRKVDDPAQLPAPIHAAGLSRRSRGLARSHPSQPRPLRDVHPQPPLRRALLPDHAHARIRALAPLTRHFALALDRARAPRLPRRDQRGRLRARAGAAGAHDRRAPPPPHAPLTAPHGRGRPRAVPLCGLRVAPTGGSRPPRDRAGVRGVRLPWVEMESPVWPRAASDRACGHEHESKSAPAAL